MSRSLCIALLIAGISCGSISAGEADLLKKFQRQNTATADKLKQEAARLLSEKASDPAALHKLIEQLQDVPGLPNSERTALIRQLGDRLRTLSPGDAVAQKPAQPQVNQATVVTAGSGTVVVPDGGVRVISGFSTLAEGRNEAGVPVLGKVPYLGRGFRNVGYGRSASGAQISATVRIISLQEEDERLLGKK